MRLSSITVLMLFCFNLQSQIVINEIQIQPAGSSTASNPQNLVDCTPIPGAEFIELYNTNPCNSVDISCYILANNIAGTSAAAHGGFRFPSGTIIPPLGFLSIGGSNSGATFNLNALCGTSNLNINPAGRWYLPNGDGYMILYDDIGNVVDAIYWTLGAGEAFKWGTDSDINTNPTRIPAGTASCPTILALSGPANLPIGLAEYIGQSSSGGFSSARQTDGSSVWVRNVGGTINACNGTCNTSNCSNYCRPDGNLAIFSNYDGGILTINVDQNIPNLKVGICTYEPIQVNFTGPFVANVTQVVYAGFNSNQNNNNCGLGNFPTSITGVPAGIVTINPPLSPPLVGYTPVHNNGAGPWGGLMIGTTGNCDTTINGGGGNTPDEIVYYFQQATAGTLLFHQTQYNCWINHTLNISAGGNCCILPPNSCPPISLSVLSSSSVSCFGGTNGSAVIAGSGGIAPYTYTWTPGNLTSASQTSLSAGTYTIKVNDNNKCSETLTLTISQPTTALTAIISSTSATGCGTSTGSATVTAGGGTPSYTYSWTPSGGNTTSVSNLSAGNNSVTVIDNNGCSIMAITNIVSSSSPTLSVLSQTNVLCHNEATGAAVVSSFGGTAPYSYSWNPSGGSSNTASNLNAGGYTVAVTDAAQCVSSINIIITEPSPISYTLSSTPALCGDVGGSATVTATGGVAPLTILWNNGSINNTIGNLSSGSYSVTITDANNCSVTGNTVVELLPTQTINGTPCVIEVPNIITPNNDNVNDFFKIRNIEYFPNTSLSIFNRWGTKLYENVNYKNEWNADGISDGTYFYIISVSKDQQYKGYVTVFRNN